MLTKDSFNKSTIIDAHTHCCGINIQNFMESSYPYSCNVSELLLRMENNDIDYSIAFPIPTSPVIIEKLFTVGNNDAGNSTLWFLKLINENFLKEIELFGKKKILPFVLLSIKESMLEQIENIKALSKKYDIYGIKIHPTNDETPIQTLVVDSTVISELNKLNLPIILHSSSKDQYCYASDILKLAQKLPDIRICIAHAGRLQQSFIEQLAEHRNVWIDVAPAIFLSQIFNQYPPSLQDCIDFTHPKNFIYYLYEKFPEKVLWGTDYPWVLGGHLSKFQGYQGDLYEKNIDILRSFPPQMSYQLSNQNILQFIFGEQTVLETCPFHLPDNEIRVLWEITSRCNMKCKHCLYYNDNVPNTGRQDLDYGNVKSIIENISKDGRVSSIWISGGEPLVRDDIVNVCSEISKHNITPSISTNGYLLTKELIQQLWDAGVRYIHLSIDGSTASTHDTLRQTPGAFARLLNGLKILASSPITTGASFMVTENSIGEVRGVYELAKSYGLKTLSFYTPAPLGRGKSIYSDNLSLNQKLSDIIADFEPSNIKIETPRIRLKSSVNAVLPSCKGSNFLTITSTGNLGACPWLMKSPFSFYVGNLLEHPFSELVEKCRNHMQSLHERRMKTLEFCDLNCLNHNRCGRGCLALSYADSDSEFYYIDPICPHISNVL